MLASYEVLRLCAEACRASAKRNVAKMRPNGGVN